MNIITFCNLPFNKGTFKYNNRYMKPIFSDKKFNRGLIKSFTMAFHASKFVARKLNTLTML